MRVLAFEDNHDVADLLVAGGVELAALELMQRWTTHGALKTIAEMQPDVLLLDHVIPPVSGLEVLRALLDAVERRELARPRTILAMSSMSSANAAMIASGADGGYVKPQVVAWEGWPRT